MKLLIITQKVNKNDPILGFFHRWIEEFSKNVESVIVVCLEKGEFNLPENVKVISLGKEAGIGRFKILINFFKNIWNFRKEYDFVFVHMNPIYLCLGGLFFKAFKKPAFLWYTHKNVDLKLRLGVAFAKKVFTASSESLRLKTKKKIVTGHGIDTEFFKPNNFSGNNQNIITVGRISEVKNIDKIVEAVSNLDGFKLDIVGTPIRSRDFDFAKDLYVSVQKNNLSDKITFSGPVTQENLPQKYNQSHIFMNMSKTGSLDKAILEALACGLQVVSTNTAARNLKGVHFILSYTADSNKNILTDKIKEVSVLGLNEEGREYVVKNHSIQSLIPKIVGLFKV